MRLEYLEVPGGQPTRVLLLFGRDTAEVGILRERIDALATGTHGDEFSLDHLPGLSRIDGCSLIATLGPSDLGVAHLDDEPLGFSCVLSPPGWRRVHELLEPFHLSVEDERFQYLSDTGPINWIISTHRGW